MFTLENHEENTSSIQQLFSPSPFPSFLPSNDPNHFSFPFFPSPSFYHLPYTFLTSPALSNNLSTLKPIIGRFMPQIRQSGQEPIPFFSSLFTIFTLYIHSPCKNNARRWKLNAMYAHRVCHQNLESRTDPHREVGRGRHQHQ